MSTEEMVLEPDIGVAARGIASGASFVGHSAAIQQLKVAGKRVAGRSSTVMLLGETGTGKEMMARFIHANSPRKDKPFVAVDCTALSDTLLESQIFGHVKGAFTGAYRDTLGFIRSADGGTLFLDEVGDLPAAMQSKLLRVIQERQVVPVGATEPIPVDFRIVCATHRKLSEMVSAGKFREDLFFRLQVITLYVPPLRERMDDLVVLAEHFLAQLSDIRDGEPKRLSSAAAEALLSHNWPGNVRELFNVMEYAHVLAEGPVIELGNLPAPLSTVGFTHYHPSDLNLDSVERRAIVAALKRTDFNRMAACRLLGIELRRLNRRLLALKIELPPK